MQAARASTRMIGPVLRPMGTCLASVSPFTLFLEMLNYRPWSIPENVVKRNDLRETFQGHEMRIT